MAAGACAIDFGTSSSAIALTLDGGADALVELEPGFRTMPTAVSYAVKRLAPHESPRRLVGRAAVAACVEGVEGRLMRSMKRILGSTLPIRPPRSVPVVQCANSTWWVATSRT
jgi:hypothetical chaperone protein